MTTLIDQSIRNLALKLIILFGASWTIAYYKKISLKDVSLKLLSPALYMSIEYFVFCRLYPMSAKANEKEAIERKRFNFLYTAHLIVNLGEFYFGFLRNHQTPIKPMLACNICLKFVTSSIKNRKYSKSYELDSGAKQVLSLTASLALDFAFQRTIGIPMIMSKRNIIIAYAGTYVSDLATHSQYSPLVKKEQAPSDQVQSHSMGSHRKTLIASS